MTTTASRVPETAQQGKGFGMQVPYEGIHEPGAYICNWSGHLLRVPEDALKPGRSPLASLSSCEPLLVTKISDNPFITLTKARVLAADCDLNVQF